MFSGLGGGRGFGSGSEHYERKEGVESMLPIDYSKFAGALGGSRFKPGKTKMGPYVNSANYLWSGFSVGYNLAESIEEKIDDILMPSESRKYIFTTYGNFDNGVSAFREDTIQINNNKSPKEVSDSLNTKAKNRWGIETKSRYEKL